MDKNEHLSERIIEDLQDMMANNGRDTYFDAVDDLMIMAKNFSTDKTVQDALQSLMDKQTADKGTYVDTVNKIDKHLRQAHAPASARA